VRHKAFSDDRTGLAPRRPQPSPVAAAPRRAACKAESAGTARPNRAVEAGIPDVCVRCPCVSFRAQQGILVSTWFTSAAFSPAPRPKRGFCATSPPDQARRAAAAVAWLLNRPPPRVWLASEKGRGNASFSEMGMGQ
jgi:hypothetical protein